MFGSKKRNAREAEVARDEEFDDVAEELAPDVAQSDDVVAAAGDEVEAETDDDVDDDQDADDEWDEFDASQDWRDDGPFDIDEVELEGDTVSRIDFGTLILTPFDGMQLQLQVDQASGNVQTALVMKDNSGLEVALFAAPRSGGLARSVRREMVDQAKAAGGDGELAEGPFGTEIRRVIPIQTPDGQQGAHVSRTWLAEGPRWLLRGVLMGEVCLGAEDGADHEFVEFFKNVIVRRGATPMPQGELITMTIPDELRPQQ